MKIKWFLITEIPSGEGTATAEASEVPGKCTTQPVRIVALKLRYHSDLTLTDQSTVENAFLTTGNPEKTGINVPGLFKKF